MKGSFEESAERENKVRGNLFMQHFFFSFSFFACNLPTVNKQRRTFPPVCCYTMLICYSTHHAGVSPYMANSDGCVSFTSGKLYIWMVHEWPSLPFRYNGCNLLGAIKVVWGSAAFWGKGAIPGCRIYDRGAKLHHSLGWSSLNEMQHNFIDPLWAISNYSGE